MNITGLSDRTNGVKFQGLYRLGLQRMGVGRSNAGRPSRINRDSMTKCMDVSRRS